MNAERLKEIEMEDSPVTDEERALGFHACPDWDYMVIRSSDVEITRCSCDCWAGERRIVAELWNRFAVGLKALGLVRH